MLHRARESHASMWNGELYPRRAAAWERKIAVEAGETLEIDAELESK
jgi:hypothetical protein